MSTFVDFHYLHCDERLYAGDSVNANVGMGWMVMLFGCLLFTGLGGQMTIGTTWTKTET